MESKMGWSMTLACLYSELPTARNFYQSSTQTNDHSRSLPTELVYIILSLVFLWEEVSPGTNVLSVWYLKRLSKVIWLCKDLRCLQTLENVWTRKQCGLVIQTPKTGFFQLTPVVQHISGLAHLWESSHWSTITPCGYCLAFIMNAL